MELLVLQIHTIVIFALCSAAHFTALDEKLKVTSREIMGIFRSCSQLPKQYLSLRRGKNGSGSLEMQRVSDVKSIKYGAITKACAAAIIAFLFQRESESPSLEDIMWNLTLLCVREHPIALFMRAGGVDVNRSKVISRRKWLQICVIRGMRFPLERDWHFHDTFRQH